MGTYEVITTTQILAGTVIILLSLVSIMKTLAYVPGRITKRRLIAISFAVLFLIGFVFALLSLLTDVRFPFELLYGSLFLGSACFVYIAFRVIAYTRDHLVQRTEQYHNAEDKIKCLSLRDELTGLYNRQGFITLMDNHLKLALRQKKRIVLFYAEIDDLERVNNNLGKQEGDMMLREAANILKAGFRGSDIIARIGEDEFIVLLIDASEDHFEAINNNFRKTLEEHNSRRHEKYKLSISTGVTSYDPGYNDSIDNMLDHVYELKGRNKAQLEKALFA
jgi:diguanylate cyclase (GGDEF)-like protein